MCQAWKQKIWELLVFFLNSFFIIIMIIIIMIIIILIIVFFSLAARRCFLWHVCVWCGWEAESAWLLLHCGWHEASLFENLRPAASSFGSGGINKYTHKTKHKLAKLLSQLCKRMQLHVYDELHLPRVQDPVQPPRPQAFCAKFGDTFEQCKVSKLPQALQAVPETGFPAFPRPS